MAQSSTRSAPLYKEHHERFYLIDDFVVLEVESTLFRLPAFILRSNSPKLKLLIGNNQGPSTTRRIELKSVSVVDFERFLLVFLPAQVGEYEIALPGEWASVLHVANVLDFPAIRKLAIDQLESVASPIDRIVLGRKYDFSKLVASGYVELCQRKAPITLLEGHSLGMSDVIDISSIRHHLRSAGDDAEISEDSVLEVCSEPGRQVLEHNAVADFVAAIYSGTGDPPVLILDPDIPPEPASQTPAPVKKKQEDPECEEGRVSVSSGRQSVTRPAKCQIRSGQRLCREAWKVKNGNKYHLTYWDSLTGAKHKLWEDEYNQRAKHMTDQEVQAFVKTTRIQALL
ncbi:hypothetical protein BDN72DRAFT_964397 [Pluteus cervinus]|uniref:Uncharacterized protein n=1 Tax=Pluteus cervinus TaxID=181527 RepID=A0ACD3AB82_9AGAR|nr:hypothetical protein BDN72DRAFT_964397 [Pluteus cervinus]